MTLTVSGLPELASAFLLVFARMGAMAMALPGIGDRAVPPRLRLVFALALTMILYPVVTTTFGPLAQSMAGAVASLLGELLIGVALGLCVRLIVSAIHMAGTAISFQTGMSFAQSVDPADGAQNMLFATFLSVLAVTLMFATDMHHLILAAMSDSYRLFPPGHTLPLGDLAQVALNLTTQAFGLALRLSAPFITFGLVFYFGVGVLSRLIPQVQVFYLALPASIFLGFVLLGMLLGTMMLWYLDYFGRALDPFLA